VLCCASNVVVASNEVVASNVVMGCIIPIVVLHYATTTALEIMALK